MTCKSPLGVISSGPFYDFMRIEGQMLVSYWADLIHSSMRG